MGFRLAKGIYNIDDKVVENEPVIQNDSEIKQETLEKEVVTSDEENVINNEETKEAKKKTPKNKTK